MAARGESHVHDGTDEKFPGNPTPSSHTPEPVRIVSEPTGWAGPSPERIRAVMRGLSDLRRRGAAEILDRAAVER